MQPINGKNLPVRDEINDFDRDLTKFATQKGLLIFINRPNQVSN
jgi:hypothetical protein